MAFLFNFSDDKPAEIIREDHAVKPINGIDEASVCFRLLGFFKIVTVGNRDHDIGGLLDKIYHNRTGVCFFLKSVIQKYTYFLLKVCYVEVRTLLPSGVLQ